MGYLSLNKTIFDTQYAKISGMETATHKVIKFLLENRSLRLSEETMNDIFTTKLRTMTPLATVFDHLANSKAKTIFTGIYPNIGRNLISVPDLLTLSSITIDLMMLPATDALNNFPEYKNKIIINLGGLIKPTGQDNKVFISDNHELQNLFVRGALCRSYALVEDGRVWLSPTLAKFIIESYCVVLSAQVSKLYGLNYAEQLHIATYFALYMSKQLYNGYGVSPAFYLCNFLGDKKYLEDIVRRNETILKGNFTIDNACELAAMNGPERMRSFSSRILNQTCTHLGVDNISNLISLEYPPYWVHQIILAMSGSKSAILYTLKQHKLLDLAKKFVQDLNISPTFIGKLEESV